MLRRTENGENTLYFHRQESFIGVPGMLLEEASDHVQIGRFIWGVAVHFPYDSLRV